jgi:hypothetical protein
MAGCVKWLPGFAFGYAEASGYASGHGYVKRRTPSKRNRRTIDVTSSVTDERETRFFLLTNGFLWYNTISAVLVAGLLWAEGFFM